MKKLVKSALLYGTLIIITFSISSHVAMEQSVRLIRYYYKTNILYLIPLLIALFIFMFFNENDHKNFIINAIITGLLIIGILIFQEQQNLIIADQYLACNENKVSFEGINTVIFEKHGRFSSISMNLSTNDGSYNVHLSDICASKIDIIIQEFLDRDISVYK